MERLGAIGLTSILVAAGIVVALGLGGAALGLAIVQGGAGVGTVGEHVDIGRAHAPIRGVLSPHIRIEHPGESWVERIPSEIEDAIGRIGRRFGRDLGGMGGVVSQGILKGVVAALEPDQALIEKGNGERRLVTGTASVHGELSAALAEGRVVGVLVRIQPDLKLTFDRLLEDAELERAGQAAR